MVGNVDQSMKGKINSQVHAFSQVSMAHFLPHVLNCLSEAGEGSRNKLLFISQLFRSEIKADRLGKKNQTFK